MEAAGVTAAPIYQVVLTIASVEPLVSDLFSVTLTPAVPAYLARVRRHRSIEHAICAIRSIRPKRARVPARVARDEG